MKVEGVLDVKPKIAPIFKIQEAENRALSLSVKVQRIWALIVELGFKEIGSVLTNAFNFFVSLVLPIPHSLNPETIEMSKTKDKIAKAVILLPGAGGGPFCFFPMAKAFEEKGIKNVFAVLKFDQTEENPVPVAPIAQKIDEIAKFSIQAGAGSVDIALIGHSLGAIAAAKWIWKIFQCSSKVNVSMMVSVAGRLHYIPNKFSWFCEDLSLEIESTYTLMKKQPDKALFYSVSGGKDELVPPNSVHIMENKEHQFVSKEAGHGGVVSAEDAISKITEWTFQWSST